ncbi:unnamed protein product [Microthlaspi erraticum]|uniref:F-box domain-containing protein n=1 Tax=Microthlaspi erraticum TaxID=1685480 RepID=A0A6D2JP35_9BRAS|nr:unnamed protein product [Microthlaspi erraticum]
MLNLPDDLLEEILCRVPAASLKPLLFSCKGWNRFLNDKRFASKHFDKAPKQFLVLMARKSSMCFNKKDEKSSMSLLSVSLNGDPAITEHSVMNPSFGISKVFHCDGLLLCTNKKNTRIVVWNPCTGQTRLIQHHSSNDGMKRVIYTLGSYKDNNSGNNSYKILRHNGHDEFEIYEFNTNAWRVVDVTPECLLIDSGVSLKGKTYWIAWDKIQGNHVRLGKF